MRQYILFLIGMFLVACSSPVPKNEWQYKSVNAFESYKNNYLEGNDLLAKYDLQHAMHSAKKSANLTTLARIYLGQCALDKSVGVANNCSKYVQILDVVETKELEAYYALISNKLNTQHLKYLAPKYKKFAQALYKHNYQKAFDAIQKCESDLSKLLWGALIHEHLNNTQRRYFLEVASINGYKKAVLFWLKELRKYEKDPQKQKILDKKIAILIK